jgi:glycosyltransferase involved in cell wall biosynthesis
MNMQDPEVTCIIPTYNDRVNLKRAVDSVLQQERVRVEVILVDDCSDSPTREFITTLAATDSRIRTFFLPENGGQAQARNIGATIAKAPFVTFLDQDDEHAPGWYRDALDYISIHPAIGALSGMASVIDIPARLGIDASDVRVYGLTFIFATNIIFRRSIFLASGGFPTAQIWRSPVAGEDGVYRHGLYYNWNMIQCDRLGLIHRAKEGGATVRYLERTEIRDGKIVITQPHELEASGELDAAQHVFLKRAGEIAAEIRRSIKEPQPRSP